MNSAVVSTFKKIFERHLFATNLGLSFGLSGLGDLIEQRLEKRKVSISKSTLNMILIIEM